MSIAPASPIEMAVIELRHTEIVDFPPHPWHVLRHFGVALDNEQAQQFIAEGLRVFCDEGGPYLVVRLPSDRPWPYVRNVKDVHIKIQPRRWVIHNETGITCWLKEIE